MAKQNKLQILDAWIMVEHLSEGNINLRERSVQALTGLQEQDYYGLLRKTLNKSPMGRNKKAGIVLYLDVFAFAEIVGRLREKYGLEKSEADMQTGHKFSCALYFDKDLFYHENLLFFTESGYIKYYDSIPQEKAFREFEQNLKQELRQDFENTATNPERFNEAVQKLIQRYQINVENCRMQVVGNLETDATNLHSFFIDDLERAKTISTKNLHAYLFGNSGTRYDLDSKSDSAKFNPALFEEILQPENYPLGRFPTNPKYALSLMQQVAVNLAIGVDNSTIRSVNGPPGTGKTTLLKDIFAELVVRQAHDICRLADKTIKGSGQTCYWENASIGVLPDAIAENNIVVASSNNGAVKNIVDELPLCENIDSLFLEKLKDADYFRELANSEVSEKWEKDENGKNRPKLILEPAQEPDRFWGLFSLEGGRSDNIGKIIIKLKAVCEELNKNYQPQPAIYEIFKKQYEEVANLRAHTQNSAQKYAKLRALKEKLHNLQVGYEADLEDIVNETELARTHLQVRIHPLQEELTGVENRAATISATKATTAQSLQNTHQLVSTIQSTKPGLLTRILSLFTGSQTVKFYEERLTNALQQLESLTKEYNQYNHEALTLADQERTLRMRLRALEKEKNALPTKVENWIVRRKNEIQTLQRQVAAMDSIYNPLDMTADYASLQLSNPWFDAHYRCKQSALFLTALRVRKQFLYENRKNVRAASIVWNNSSNYLEDSKRIILQAAWRWINFTVPVISSTFASFGRMCKHLGPETLGHLFIDEAGQALPQAAVGAVFRSRHVMVVGDPSQIKPVLTLDSSILKMLGDHFGVSEKYLSESASTQTLVDAASRFGFYKEQDRAETSWIGIPLWVHRRCCYPMFTISNKISYGGFMVQGLPKDGKAGWYDVGGMAEDKYVPKQAAFLVEKIQAMIDKDPSILNPQEKDKIYVISPFRNVAYRLAKELEKIRFTRKDPNTGKTTNIGTIHTFQGKEAPIVFLVLGADTQSKGAARWAVSEANMMNVAATRAKQEFYIIGDKKLYQSTGSPIVTTTLDVLSEFQVAHPQSAEESAG